MSGIDLYLNVSYVAYVLAPAIRDELWLRILLTMNALAFVGWGLWIDNRAVMFWNGLFALISSYHIVRILRERQAVSLTDEQRRARDALFPGLSNRDFLLFWTMGETHEFDEGGHVTSHGEHVEHLHLILDGEVGVERGADRVATLREHDFVGEMSFVSGEVASATCVVHTPTRTHAWSHEHLAALREIEPRLVAPLLGSINRDLANKLRA